MTPVLTNHTAQSTLILKGNKVTHFNTYIRHIEFKENESVKDGCETESEHESTGIVLFAFIRAHV